MLKKMVLGNSKIVIPIISVLCSFFTNCYLSSNKILVLSDGDSNLEDPTLDSNETDSGCQSGVSIVDLRITEDPAPSWNPVIAYNPADNEYGVVWIEDRYDAHELYFARISDQAEKLSDDIRLTYNSTMSLRSSLVWAGSRYAMAWEEGLGGDFPEMSVYLATFSGDGGRFSDTLISEIESHQANPSLVYTGSNFTVAWEDRRDGNSEIYVAFLDLERNKLGSDIRVTQSEGDSLNPTIVFSGEYYRIIWTEYHKIYLTDIDSLGNSLGDAITVTNEASDFDGPSMAFSGSEYGITWIEYSGSELQVIFTRFDPLGQQQGSDIIIGAGSSATIMWNGSYYGLVWAAETEALFFDINFARLDPTGSVSGFEGKVSSAYSAMVPEYPAGSGSERNWAVSWNDDWSGASEVYFAIINCIQ